MFWLLVRVSMPDHPKVSHEIDMSSVEQDNNRILSLKLASPLTYSTKAHRVLGVLPVEEASCACHVINIITQVTSAMVCVCDCPS